jgi:hypothetical protein
MGRVACAALPCSALINFRSAATAFIPNASANKPAISRVGIDIS